MIERHTPGPSSSSSTDLSISGPSELTSLEVGEDRDSDGDIYHPSPVTNPWLHQDGAVHTYVMALEETKKICRDNVGWIGPNLNATEIARIIYVASGEEKGSATARVAAIIETYKALVSKGATTKLREDVAQEFFKMILTEPSKLERLRRTGGGLLQAAALVPTTIGILAAAETFASTAFGVSIVMNAPVVVPVMLLAAIVPGVLVAVGNAVRKRQASKSTQQGAADIIRASISGLASYPPSEAAEISQSIVVAAQRIFVGMDKGAILSAVRSGAAFTYPATSRAIIAACKQVSPGKPMRLFNRTFGTNLGGVRTLTR